MSTALIGGGQDETLEAPSRAAPHIERAPLPMMEVEGPEHLVCFVNAAFCRLLKKNAEELVGQPFEKVVHNGDKCVSLLDRVYETGEFETHIEADHTGPAPAYWLFAMWPTLGADERPERVVIQLTKAAHFHQNLAAMNEALLVAGLRQHELREEAEKANIRSQAEIAVRLLAEIALRDANVHLTSATGVAERANKAKDDFLAALSHELRTPLTPVLIAAAFLREDPRLPADVRDQLGMMERNIALEARLIDDLLDLTKISHGKLFLRLEPCDAHTLIDLATEIVQDDAHEKSIVIERIFNARHSGLMADPSRFQQIIWNLLRNAVKFSPQGGKISVRTSEERMGNEGIWFRVEISDNGIGIEPARLEQIFLPFDQGGLTGDHRFSGVGLGLAIARAVVVLHGGRITATSAGLNCGAMFAVDLPNAVEPRSGVAENVSPFFIATPTLAPLLQKIPSLRLLLVEDHKMTLQSLSRLLQRDGHHVVTATTAAEALGKAARHSFDLVISDLGLPDGSGLELMAKLSANYGLRGIALSGYGMEDDITRSRNAGFVTHLVKPIPIAELRRAIASLAPAPNP